VAREMKDSRLAWLGSIPVDWALTRAKNLFRLTNGRGNPDNPVLLAATQKYGMWPQDRLEGVVRIKAGTDLSTFRTVHKGDYVISLRSFQGGFESSEFEGVCSPAYQTFCASRPLDHVYYKCLFKSPTFIDHMDSLTLGIREGKTIRFADFAVCDLPVPPIDEQRRIADYLDAKCVEIDTAEEAAETSIGDYLSMRHALISNAVTHGVDGSNSARKDLGVPYVDGVPVSWSKAKLVWLLSAFIDCPHETPDYSADGPFLVIRAGDQTEGGLVQDNMLRLDSGEYERRTRRSKLLANDIVYGREGNWGKASLVPETDKYCLGQRMMQFRCNESKLEPRFATYALNAEYIRELNFEKQHRCTKSCRDGR
jgi:type I restriction enzyme S subunit